MIRDLAGAGNGREAGPAGKLPTIVSGRDSDDLIAFPQIARLLPELLAP